MCDTPHPGDHRPALTGIPPRIVGVGSPHGNDRLGWEIAMALGHPLAGLAPEIRCCDRPGALLLEELDGAELAFIIDAMTAGLRPGSIRCFTPAALFQAAGGRASSRSVPDAMAGLAGGAAPRLSSHGFGVVEALQLGRLLDRLPARLYVLGVETGEAAAPVDVAQASAEAARLIMAKARRRDLRGGESANMTKRGGTA